MVGILVHGNNNFILSGPRPDEAVCTRTARHWSSIQIGRQNRNLDQWQIRTKNSAKISNGSHRPGRT